MNKLQSLKIIVLLLQCTYIIHYSIPITVTLICFEVSNIISILDNQESETQQYALLLGYLLYFLLHFTLNSIFSFIIIIIILLLHLKNKNKKVIFIHTFLLSGIYLL